MRYLSSPIWLILIILWASGLHAQSGRAGSPATLPGEFLVQLHPQSNPASLAHTLEQLPSAGFRDLKPVVPVMHIWQVNLDTSASMQQGLLELLRTTPGIVTAQHNHQLTLRSTPPPNDPFLQEQWQYHNTGQNGGTPGADMNIGQAWDFTTGGLTASGDTVVACIIDEGFDPTHEDLRQNLWVNHAEISGNYIDDDGNGYVDDYHGWNPMLQNDEMTYMGGQGWHGPRVAGIVGARGDNGAGIAGVNWEVKLMCVLHPPMISEAGVLAAYAYPLAMRKRYNATQGAEGAYVVTTNASWGLDLKTPADAPLWCAMYDSLGAAGILSCGATSNSEYNVDQVGDLPTSCTSNYLIAVTNLNHNDVKATAGYGTTSVDLGAYGTDIYTVFKGNGYAPAFNGTSAATPHVTGVVALLYAAPCPAWAAYQHAHPDSAALLVKQAILGNTTSLSSLQGKTVTGGKLNAGAAMQWLMNHFGCLNTCLPPARLRVAAATASSAVIQWQSLNLPSDSFRVYWRTAGVSGWPDSALVFSNSFQLSGLLGCTRYEVRIAGFCQGSRTPSSQILSLLTEGCEDCARKYCAMAANSTREWIASLVIDTMLRTSGDDGGYLLVSNSPFVLQQRDSVLIEVTPGYSGPANDMYSRVWADFNNNGDFYDAGELILDPQFAGTGTVSGLMVVPADAHVGTTRLRVATQLIDAPDPCGIIRYGEVEDYCLVIEEYVGLAPDVPQTISLWPQPAQGMLHITGLNGIRCAFRLLDMQGKVLGTCLVTGNTVALPALPAGVYLVECEVNGSVFRQKCLVE